MVTVERICINVGSWASHHNHFQINIPSIKKRFKSAIAQFEHELFSFLPLISFNFPTLTHTTTYGKTFAHVNLCFSYINFEKASPHECRQKRKYERTCKYNEIDFPHTRVWRVCVAHTKARGKLFCIYRTSEKSDWREKKLCKWKFYFTQENKLRFLV